MINAVIIVAENGKAGIWNRKHAPRYESEEQWRNLCREKFGCDEAQTYHLDGVALPNCERGGVWFNEELVNSDGMGFLLFKEPGHTTSDIADAKSWLRSRRDAVVFYVKNVEWIHSEQKGKADDGESRGNEDQPGRS